MANFFWLKHGIRRLFILFNSSRRSLLKGTLLIGAEGAKTPAGVRARGDPAGAKRRGGSLA
ncbi:hypothetical protein V7161_29405, partial [Neobacillus drentensis]